MASSRSKESDAPANPIKSATEAADDGLSRFTWNVRGFNESLTIRTDSEEELKQLRDKWSQVINPPRRKIPYQHSGDKCLNVECAERGGVMVTRTGTNRKTQQPYNFLRCSNSPACQLYSYIENEANTPEQNGENGNGGNGVAKATTAASASA